MGLRYQLRNAAREIRSYHFHRKRISVRLASEEYLRLRLAAARRGTTIQRSVGLAIDSLLTEVAPMAKEPRRRRTEFRGFLADTDVIDVMKQDRRGELRRDRSRL